jgi:tetratricopeptide (TPR) repeat protein
MPAPILLYAGPAWQETKSESSRPRWHDYCPPAGFLLNLAAGAMNIHVEKILLAAQGYLELGMAEDTLAELAALPASALARLDALHLRLGAHMHLRHWETALEISRRLCESHPEETSGFIHAAFCLHELHRTSEAKRVLLSGPASLLREATYYYNLGCYDAALGNVEEAQAHLRASFKLDRKFRQVAKTDPDLKAVWGLL